jgi:hypothetical protein
VTWLKVDDKLTTHPKWLKLTLEAKSLWFHAAVWCAAHNNDGAIPDDAMPLIAFSGSLQPHLIDEAADRLVTAKLWKRRPKKAGGGFEINDWLDYQPSRQQVRDRAEADDLKNEIKKLHAWLHKKKVGKHVKAIIDRRDGMFCRYCSELTVVTEGDRRSSQRRTYDLVDPHQRWDVDARALSETEMEQIAGYWAVSCGWCNAVKARRTPDEAGMELLPPPSDRRLGHLPRSVPNRSGTVPVVGPGLSGSERNGPGRAGAGQVVDASEGTEGARPRADLEHEDISGEGAA